MSRNPIHTWLALAVAAVGLLISAILGLWAYMSVTASPLHPSPQDVPSVTHLTPPPQWAGAVDRGRQLARAHLVERNLPGLSVAAGADGEIVWAEGFGWADSETRLAVAPDMRFRIGTASTALTSAAVGLLMEKGRLKLDDDIQTYVPAFPRKQWPVTPRQLMGHLAGISNDGGDEGPLFSVHCARPADALPHFAERPLLFEPGSQYKYSSYGWILLSAAVEAAAGQPFLSFMRRQIFDPLGMHDTRADAAEDRVTSYFPRFAADPRYGPDVNREIDLSCYAGSGVFLSTPSDLVRFAMAMNGGLGDGSGSESRMLLQRATVQLLQTSQRLPSGAATGYGLGWDLETAPVLGRQTAVVGHDGDVLGGMVASFMTFPEHGITVSVTSNISYSDTYSLAVKIAAAFAEHRRPAQK